MRIQPVLRGWSRVFPPTRKVFPGLISMCLTRYNGLTASPDTIRAIVEANFMAVAEAVSVLWPDLVESAATMVGFGSVTVTRGLARDYVDAAKKRPLKPSPGRVIEGLGRDRGLTYFPRWWRWVTLVLRLLPWGLYRRVAG